jgi:hypothetical protein
MSTDLEVLRQIISRQLRLGVVGVEHALGYINVDAAERVDDRLEPLEVDLPLE